MDDVNSYSRKISPSVEIIFEVNSGDISPFQSPIPENMEPNAKVARLKLTEHGDPNLYPENSVDMNVSVHEKILELQEENMKLKGQVQDTNHKLCKCGLEGGNKTVDNVDAVDKPLISIKFQDESVAELYRNKFQSFLTSFTEFIHKNECLEINVIKNNDINSLPLSLEITPQEQNKFKRKRKKSRTGTGKELFMVDTTPSITTKGNGNLKYTSKYSVTQTDDLNINEDEITKPTFTQTCFNCDCNHSLRDCPEPKNFSKINIARQKLKSVHIGKVRYHLEEDQKYSHLVPGIISHKLKAALGLRGNQLPEYIYRMRVIGYPPGWMEEAQVTHSDISLYDMEGKNVRCSNKQKQGIDASKVIEYIGFNMPIDKGTKDDYDRYECPPYSEKCSKHAMLEYINKMVEEKDNLETCDMEIDLNVDEEIEPARCESLSSRIVEENYKLGDRLSPSLTELERKKLELLAALNEHVSNTGPADENCNTADKKQLKQISVSNTKVTEKVEARIEKGSLSENDQEEMEMTVDTKELEVILQTADELEKSESINVRETVTITDDQIEENIESELVKSTNTPVTPRISKNEVKKSSFGTPILKSASLFNNLPHAENFSKGVSPVINFENLPNCTGKYEQMTQVLSRVRRTLKSLSDQS